MDLPVVNHKDYFAKIGDDHKFPINKFGDLADFLLRNKIVTKFHKPYPCSDETLKGAHSEKYIKEIKNNRYGYKNGVRIWVFRKILSYLKCFIVIFFTQCFS